MQEFATSKVSVWGSTLYQLSCFFLKNRQAARIMKITSILLLAGCLQISAKGITQTVSIDVKDAPLLTVLKAIEKQTDFVFFVNNKQLQKARKVTVTVYNLPLQRVLDMCFKDQPLTYSISGKVINVIPRQDIDKGKVNGSAGVTDITVKGRVVNESNDPVEGVNVMVKGTSTVTSTNSNGEFYLTSVNENATLVFTSINLETLEVKLNGRSDLTINLQTKVTAMQEVVVNKGYYTEKRKLATGNVSTIKSTDIGKQPINNPLLALQGRVPGLFITQATGLPGTGITVRVQGQISLGPGNDPLFVIDGVPYVSQMLPTFSSLNVLGSSGGGSASGSGNPLSFLNPADIESVDVLKDADATSIYGSRAAGGAILITTKKGKAGQTKVDVNFNSGWGKVMRKLDLMNTDQYLSMRRQAFQNDGQPIPNSSSSPNFFNYDLTVWDSTRYTDWQKVLIGNAAHYTDGQVSVSGGNSNTHFLVGGGYHRETTVFPGNLSDQKGSVHVNIDNVSPNRKFKLQVSGMYLVDNNNLQGTDLAGIAVTLPPNAPAIYKEDGTLNWAPTASGTSTWNNPLSYFYSKYKIKTNNLISNAIVSYEVIPGLSIKSNIGYTNLQSSEKLIFPLLTYAPEERTTRTRSSSFGNSTISSWIIEPQATYSFGLGKGKFEALVGTTFQQRNSDNQQLNASGFNSDAVLEDIKSASAITVNSTLSSVYNYNAVFGRLNYKWQEKYVINVTGRRDGSSRFGSSNLFNNFWSVAGAWIISEEKWIKEKLSFISYGKLRASYGTSGNDQIGDYRFMNLYSPVTTTVTYQGATGLLPDRVPNSHVQWEETQKLGLGAEIGLFNNRILTTINYYRNRSSNQLLSYPLPSITGFSTIPFINLPATIENTGWELTLQTTNIQGKNIKWSTNINVTIPRNKLVEFPGIEISSLSSLLVVGQPFTIEKAYSFMGVDPATGVYQFIDSSGAPIFRPVFPRDATKLYDVSPKFYGGFQNTITYKSFELDFLFQFVKQIGKNHSVLGTSFPGVMVNQPAALVNAWSKAGDEATIQKYTQGSNSNALRGKNFFGSSTAAWTDASYIRLKNVSLSWTMPKSWISKIKTHSARLYIQGQNLLTITDYFGDPETKSISTLPPLSILTIGVQVTF